MSDHIREKQLRHKLARLQREYRERAQPIIDQLVEIEWRKPPKPVVYEPSDFTDIPSGMNLKETSALTSDRAQGT